MIDVENSSFIKYLTLTPLMKSCLNGENIVGRLTAENVNESMNNTSAFMCTCFNGDSENISEFLKFPQLEFSQQNESWENALFFACENGSLKNFHRIFESREWNLRCTSCTGKTLLMHACMRGHKDIVDFILKKDPSITELQDSGGNVALMYACAGGHLDIVQKLLSMSTFEPSKYNNAQNETFFMAACFGGNAEIAKLFFEDEDFSRVNGRKTALMFAAESGNVEILKMILEKHPKELNKKDDNNESALMLACKKGNIVAVRYLLNIPDIDVNMVSDSGNSALSIACWEDTPIEIAEALLEHHNIDINKTSENKETPLMVACNQGRFDVARKLLKKEKIHNINLKDNNGETAFMKACGNFCDDNAGFIDYLLENFKIDVNAQDKWGRTALYFACGSGHLEIVRSLLKQKNIDIKLGGNLLIPTCAGNINSSEKRTEIISILLNLPKITFDINEGDDAHDTTPLMFACKNNYVEIIKLLLKQPKIKVNKLEDGYNISAFMYACSCYPDGFESVKVMAECKKVKTKLIDVYGRSALTFSANKKVLQYLMDSGIFTTDDILAQKECLANLITHSNQDAQVWFIKKYGDYCCFNYGDYMSPLQTACSEGYQQTVKALCERDDVDLNYIDKRNNVAILWATDDEFAVPCAELLLSSPKIDINHVDEDGRNPLMLACKNGALNIARKIVELNVLDINAKDLRGNTALIHACRSFNLDLVRYLLSLPKININMTNKKGKTALIAATKINNISIVRELLNQNGIDAATKTISGKTALDYAVEKNYILVADMLSKL